MPRPEQTPDILTPEQVARYLQIDRETVYRYIRQGKLEASRLGRSYRILRRSVDLLLLATRARRDIKLREYTPEQLEQFIAADELTESDLAIVRHFNRVMDAADEARTEEVERGNRTMRQAFLV